MRTVASGLVVVLIVGCASAPPPPAEAPPPAADTAATTQSAPATTSIVSAEPSPAPAASSEPSSPTPAGGPSRTFKPTFALTEHDKEGTYWVTLYESDVKCGQEPKETHIVTSGPWKEGKTTKKVNLVSYSKNGTSQNNSQSTEVAYGKKPSEKAPTSFTIATYSVEVEYDDPLIHWTIEGATVPVTLCKR